MSAIAFDLTVADAERFHLKGSLQAYADIASTLRRFGFTRAQGSVYVTNDENLANLSMAMNALKAMPWFARVVRDIRAFRVEQWSDFTEFMKST